MRMKERRWGREREGEMSEHADEREKGRERCELACG